METPGYSMEGVYGASKGTDWQGRDAYLQTGLRKVFEAFVNPAITSKFWFTKGNGRLQGGKTIRWDWEMHGQSVQVKVKAVKENKQIHIEWGAFGTPTTVEWVFTSRPDSTTFVSITNTGFGGDHDEVVKQALDSTEGFILVLAGLKALLEHHITLNLVLDRFPDTVKRA